MMIRGIAVIVVAAALLAFAKGQVFENFEALESEPSDLNEVAVPFPAVDYEDDDVIAAAKAKYHYSFNVNDRSQQVYQSQRQSRDNKVRMQTKTLLRRHVLEPSSQKTCKTNSK